MLNIEHLLMEQRYLALDEISTVFLAIGIAQYTIYHFKYRKYKNSLAIGMILMIISILYLHLNKWYSTNKQNLTSAFFTYKGVDEFERY